MVVPAIPILIFKHTQGYIKFNHIYCPDIIYKTLGLPAITKSAKKVMKTGIFLFFLHCIIAICNKI